MNTEAISEGPVGLANYQKTLVSGAVVFSLRFAVSGLSMLGLNIYLMSAYTLVEVGYLAVLLVVANVALFLSDFGMGSACVQRQRLPDDREASALFFAASMTWAVIIAAVGSVAVLSGFQLAWMILAIACSAPLNGLRQMSTMAAETRLAYGSLAAIDIAESLTLLIVTIVLSPWGVWGFVVATAAKSAVGWACSSRIRHFRLIPAWPLLDVEGRRLFGFGIRFHAGSVLTSIRQLVNPVAVGAILGMVAVGLSDRAVFIAGAPLLFLGAVQQRILFPFFSAIQHEPDRRRQAFERAVHLSACIDKAAYLVLVIAIGPLIERYLPAYISMIPWIWVLIIANVLFGAIVFACFPVLNALGKAHVVARLHLMTTLASWILIWPMVALFGLPGYILTNLTLWAGVGYLVFQLHHFIPGVRVIRSAAPPVLAFCCALALCTLGICCLPSPMSLGWTIVIAVSSLPLYALMMYLIDRQKIMEIVGVFRHRSLAKGPADVVAER